MTSMPATGRCAGDKSGKFTNSPDWQLIPEQGTRWTDRRGGQLSLVTCKTDTPLRGTVRITLELDDPVVTSIDDIDAGICMDVNAMRLTEYHTRLAHLFA